MSGPDLGKKVGPFTLGAWGAIVVVGAGAGLLIRRSGLLDGGEPPADLDLDGAPTFRGGIGTSGTGVTTPPVVTDPTAPVVEVPRTNERWLAQAVAALVAQGVTGSTADGALRKYLFGYKVTAPERAAIDIAVGTFGTPPEGAPPIEMADPPPTSPTAPPAPVPARLVPKSQLGRRVTSVQNNESLLGLSRRLYGSTSDRATLVKYNPGLREWNTSGRNSKPLPVGLSIVY